MISRTLKLVREVTRLSAPKIANAMGMARRTYYSFEAGKGEFSFARIWRFAEATGADPMAIIYAVIYGEPEIAVRSMENQGASIGAASFKRFNDRVGDRMTNIASSIWIEALKRPYDCLEEHLEKRDQSTERWLAENIPKLFPRDED
ncbi:XRE family transcriptional regulator [Caulobacter radicis]|uniref:helix-turn-helix domain-containing protein n=1 Tax=Caulobacter radicis TaxID=2172650 RepID=UPI000D583542|nr:helix-turn-helix transcriptional regulator [Caulobacter radicis]PVM91755.1 XRE family transcriptional regulator [Caulobacter radicis]